MCVGEKNTAGQLTERLTLSISHTISLRLIGLRSLGFEGGIVKKSDHSKTQGRGNDGWLGVGRVRNECSGGRREGDGLEEANDPIGH